MPQLVTARIDRALAFLYFRAIQGNPDVSLQEIIHDFDSAGLAKPNITWLRKAIAKDRRTTKVKGDRWRLKADKVKELEKGFQLAQCLEKKLKHQETSGTYVNKGRFQELRSVKSDFDLSRLIQMLSELDHAFLVGNYISVIMLVRGILDHIPPIFSFDTFAEVTNNYKGSKSFKESMKNLENSSRKIADAYLHNKIRRQESLPNENQVNFSNDLDVLLGEIIRLSN